MTVRVATTVVAVCEGPQHETTTATTNSVHLGRSFRFEATYKPAASILFRLSFTLADDVTLYLRFTPDLIASLKRMACGGNEGGGDSDNNHNNRPPHFETIRRDLDSPRGTLTRLQFSLHSHRRGQFIVPKGFDPNHYNNNNNGGGGGEEETRRILASLAALAAAPTFSLYMHDRDMPKAQYQAVYHAYQSWPAATGAQIEALEQMTDLRTLYKGRGGALLDAEAQDGLLLLPGYTECPPEYTGPASDYLLPPSQQSTASKAASSSSSDVATVAVSTPPGYRDNDHRCGHGGAEEPSGKRIWSSGSEKASSWRPSAKRRAKGPSPRQQQQQHDNATSIEALQAELRGQREQVEILEEENVQLQSRIQDLEERLATMEELQETVDDKVAVVEVNHDSLRLDHEGLEERFTAYEAEDRATDWLEPGWSGTFGTRRTRLWRVFGGM
ncbi:hypothetical protein PG994_000879 [Apiospora phragmitis]|uniref:Uncharacterized protein n=1 Tax=Apiospora phragmitis TaxID=2905665 RepID=A0ABR1WQU2_9PEZI